MPLGRIKRQRRTRPQRRRNSFQPVKPRRQDVARIEGAQPLHRSLERPGRLDQRQIGRRELCNRAGILGVQPIAQPVDILDRQRPGGERIDQVREREVDRHARRASRGQCLDRHRHHLACRRDGIETDQLAPDLPRLALRLQRAATQLQHRTGIAQANGARMVRHARRGNARDLGRDVRPDRHGSLAHRIDEPHGIGQPAILQSRAKPVGEFRQRRIDPLIAIGMRQPQHTRLYRRRRIGMRRQPITKPLGKKCGHP